MGWPAIEDHPPGVDLAYWRSMMTRSNVIITAGVSVVLAVLLTLPSVRAYLHLASSAPAWLAATWPLTVAATRGRGRGLMPPAAPWLACFFLHGIAGGSSIGAASESPFSAGWALFLVFPPSWAAAFPHNRMLLGTFVVVPPIARVVLAPSPSASSIAYAAAIGVAAAASFVVLSRRRMRLRAQEEARLRGQALGANAVDDAASLLAAMRVHDGLSGSLMLAHTRASITGDPETIDAARAFIERARVVLLGFSSSRSSDVHAWLDTLGRDLGLELTVEVRGRRVARASAEVHDVVIELLSNQARHGERGPCRLVVEIRRGRTRIELRAPAARKPDGTGRGTRNLARRIAASGGTIRTTWRGGVACIALIIPSGLGGRIAGTLVHVAPPIMSYAWSGDTVVFAAMGVLSGLLVIVANANNLRVARDHDRRHGAIRAQIDEAAQPTLAGVHGELTSMLDCLGRAVEDRRAADVRAQLAQLASWMKTKLSLLETAGFSPGVLAAAPRARLADDSSP